MTAAEVVLLAVLAQPFSHKLHLKLKLECATCHPGAALSRSAADNLLPAREVCLKCHDTAEIPSPAATGVDKFNHALHTKLPNIGKTIAEAIDNGRYLSPVPAGLRAQLETATACTACHRGMAESIAISKANMPSMADCLVCHSKIEPPFSCEKCHDSPEGLKPASHTQEWVDQHTDGRLTPADKQTCAVCHGRRFRCQGCH